MNNLLVNVAKIRDNILRIKDEVGAKFCAVVKAGCYGVGLQLCKYVADIVECFAVATIDEAKQLRQWVDKQILVLSPPTMSHIAPLNPENTEGVAFAVDDLDTLKAMAESGKNYSVHLVANTGMNRYGASFDEFLEMLEYAKAHQNIKVEGAFSHFLKGDKATQMRQYANFVPCIKAVKEAYPDAICHIANSGGQNYPIDMVRVGIGLYDPPGQNITTLQSSIAKIRTVPAGQTIGYGCRCKVQKPTTIAVVPMGYADGIMRKFSGANVLIEGTLCPIVGSVCMDCFFVDITDCPTAHVGSVVTIWGTDGVNSIEIGSLAKKCSTINYELLTHVGNRVKREYLE